MNSLQQHSLSRLFQPKNYNSNNITASASGPSALIVNFGQQALSLSLSLPLLFLLLFYLSQALLFVPSIGFSARVVLNRTFFHSCLNSILSFSFYFLFSPLSFSPETKLRQNRKIYDTEKTVSKHHELKIVFVDF